MNAIRSVSTVKEEISDLKYVIEGLETAIQKHPEHIMLKHSLQQYQNRMNQLRQELSEAKRLRS